MGYIDRHILELDRILNQLGVQKARRLSSRSSCSCRQINSQNHSTNDLDEGSQASITTDEASGAAERPQAQRRIAAIRST